MSGSSYCPRSAVYVHETAPRSLIHATATEVSRPPEKAIPTRSPTGREVSTLDTMQVYAQSCISIQPRRPALPSPPRPKERSVRAIEFTSAHSGGRIALSIGEAVGG